MPSLYAIGDIHGQRGQLDALLAALPRESGDFTVFLGDYIDRGADSRGVVRRILAEYDAAPDRTILLWGNHEDMAAGNYGFYAPSLLAYDPFDWLRNGGLTALQSWGLAPPEAFRADCPDELARLFPLLRTFYRGSDSGIAGLETFLFVHAGILPEQEPEDTPGETLLWVREAFLDSFDPYVRRIVVHGHTPFPVVRAHPDKIGIDTGAVRGGPLTALRLPERTLYQAEEDGSVAVAPLHEWWKD